MPLVSAAVDVRGSLFAIAIRVKSDLHTHSVAASEVATSGWLNKGKGAHDRHEFGRETTPEQAWKGGKCNAIGASNKASIPRVTIDRGGGDEDDDDEVEVDDEDELLLLPRSPRTVGGVVDG